MPGKNPSRGGGGSGSAWNLQEIRQLIDLLIEREINEFEMERSGVRIRIKRGNSLAEVSGPGGFTATVPAPWPSPPPVHAAPAPAPSGGMGQTETEESSEELYIIKSPIVGTFYGSPSPNAPHFVKLGDVVEVGQPLCIIEAMKLMNEIEAEAAGEIVRIYVENGQPVEYGQSLFAINPSHKK
ncbi:MAG: acetyl-CoA carboxylase biotin carboxyl carrier protein [Terriglobia bacterium]